MAFDGHTKAKSFYAYDVYVDNGLCVEAKPKVHPFEHFKQWGVLVVEVPQETKGPQLGLCYKLVGNRCGEGTKFALSTQELIVFVRSLIRGIQGNLEDGHCFEEFHPKNVVVTQFGEALFRQLHVVSANDSTKKLTYENAHRFILNLLEGLPIPEDLWHLLSLLQKPEKEPLYAIHPALVLPTYRCSTFEYLYEIFKHRLTNSKDQESILFKLPYLADWRLKVGQNDVLMEAYTYNNCYSELPDLNGHKKKIHEGKMFLLFIRNAIAHKLERQIKITPLEFERIINAMFPLLLPMLQEAIFEVVGEERFQVFMTT